MIAAQGVSGLKVAVLGLGRSGLSAARALIAGGAEVLAWDDGEQARGAARDAGLALSDLGRLRDWSEIALCVVSPGIAHLYPKAHPVIGAALAAGVPVDNDIGVFFRSFSSRAWDNFQSLPKIIAVTGSNGKSTTSALIHHILTQVGWPSQLAGNIGRGVLDLDPATDGEVVVLELSSYQTELARSLTPDVGVFTNLSPDHLDRHGGEGGYFAAKRRLFAEGGPDRAVIGVDEPAGIFLAGQLSESANDDRVIRISSGQKLIGPGWQVFARKGFLSEMRKGRQIASMDLRDLPGLAGAHNHQNACAAYAACRAVGISPKAIAEALASFQGLAHRSQLIAEGGGLRFINDSKATNLASAANALAAFENVRWICGGLQKDGGLEPLNAALGPVIKAYVIGREAADFARQLECPSAVCTTMQAAVVQAVAEAGPGETVLLAPAAASFDQYDNFEQRGDDFIAEVRRHLTAQ
ncbi:MAG: UDP-N-acetylmuramoyl-L-alanine--D-glutamate ligase [Marinovum sp.]|nr:UDP-N-acetylmuramoyl-L-alanine--D-glutamate ligase [Marinovum sp.]